MPRNNHAGLTLRIKALLAASAQPMKQREIAQVLSVPLEKVRSSLTHMIGRLGGACEVGREGNFKLYGVPGRDDLAARRGAVNVAAGRYVAPPGVYVRDPFEHQKLALAGPR